MMRPLFLCSMLALIACGSEAEEAQAPAPAKKQTSIACLQPYRRTGRPR